MSVYIRTAPDKVVFTIPYSDMSGDKIKVSLSGKKTDVEIKTFDSVLIDVEDIDWLRQVLDDIKSFIELDKEEKK